MAATERSAKTGLSKNLLQMKFMKKSAIRVEKEQNEAEFQQIDDQHWVLDIPELAEKESKFQTESSFARCEQLKFGRMSFRGFNPEIEKLMKIYDTEAELEAAGEREREIGVNDEEMTKRYSSLVGTIGKKFAKKRKPEPVEEETPSAEGQSSQGQTSAGPPVKKKKKKKFMKPVD